MAQSDSDTEDTSFNLNTIVKVEAPNEEDDDLYGEGQSNLDDYKTEYFDTFKSDDKNEYIDAFKSGNLSDDSSGGPYSSFLTGTDYQNGSGIGRELGLTSTQMARLSSGRDCDILKNSTFRGFTNNLESDSDMSGMDGLSGDALSLPDMDSSAYPSSYTSLPSTYMDPQGNMKIQLQNLDTPKKVSEFSHFLFFFLLEELYVFCVNTSLTDHPRLYVYFGYRIYLATRQGFPSLE